MRFLRSTRSPEHFKTRRERREIIGLMFKVAFLEAMALSIILPSVTSTGEIPSPCAPNVNTCLEQSVIPAIAGNTNSTICTKTVTHSCTPIVLNPTNIFFKDTVFVIVVTTTATMGSNVVTDNAGDIYGLVSSATLTSTSAKVFFTTVGTTIPTSISITIPLQINGQSYGAMEASAVGYSQSASATIGQAKQLTMTGTTSTLSFTLLNDHALTFDGVSIQTGSSCQQPISSVNNQILNQLNLNAGGNGCSSTSTNGAWADGQITSFGGRLPLTGDIITSDYSWQVSASAYLWMIEIDPVSKAQTVALYYDSEVQTSSTVVAGTNTPIRSYTDSNFPNNIVEVEGYVTTGVTSVSQTLTFSFQPSGTCSSTAIITTPVSESETFAFRCVNNAVSNNLSLTYTAGSTDAATTIVVNSYRLYAVL